MNIKKNYRNHAKKLLKEKTNFHLGASNPMTGHSIPIVDNMGLNVCQLNAPDCDNQKLYDFRWDSAGNLGQISTGNAESMFESGRFLFWTEDNRMHTAVDEEFYSYYAYDHSGERRIKLTGENSVLDVNAEIMSTLSTLDKVTLYPSAYVVLTDRGYTKHYYTGMERIAARIGDGGLNVGIYLSDTDSLHARADRLFGQSLDQVNCRVLDANEMGCILDGAQDHVELGILVEEIPERMLATVGTEYGEFISAMHLISGIGESSDVYYYHSDHLGSASWITDSSGIPVQHLQYMPFGEPFVNQRISGYSERFTFTGKERDEETGYGYFGARYMDHELMTGWLSVDPMADKYPNISPYAYCVWNPVKLVDPDGERPIPLIDNYKGWIVRVDSWFGPRNISVKRASKFHKGLDFNYSGGGDTDRGAPILATHGGVASVDTDPRGGEGRSVTITALNNKIRTRYFHLQSINVSDGDNVSESDNIATMGGSGFGNDNAYSSHLHYEIQINLDGDWVSIDPTLGLDDDLNNIVDPQRIIDSKELDCSITLKEVKIIDNKTSIDE